MVSRQVIHKTVRVSVIVALMVVMIGSVSATPSAEDPVKEGPFTIGVAMRTQNQPRWIFDVDNMEQRAAELGDTLLVQWADEDAAKQQSQVENLIAQGMDVLILAPVNDTAAPKLVELAKEAGIPVVAYDAPITNADIDYALTRDVYETGLWQAGGCLQMYPPDADNPPNIALVKGDEDYVHAQIWNQAYHDVLDPLVDEGTVKIVAEQWNKQWKSENALKMAENALTANNDDVQCFVTSNDGMAVGVSQAAKARNLGDKVYISGLDADIANLQLILDDVQTLSIWTKIDEMAREAVNAADALASNGRLEYDAMVNNGVKDVPTALIEVYPVTKENICEWITQVAPPGWATAEEVFGDRPIPDECKQ